MSYDVSLGPDPDEPGHVLAHRPDCPMVRHQAEVLFEPVVTMLDCEKPLPDDIPLHECLA